MAQSQTLVKASDLTLTDNAGNTKQYTSDNWPENLDNSFTIEPLDDASSNGNTASDSPIEINYEPMFLSISLDKTEVEAPATINISAQINEKYSASMKDAINIVFFPDNANPYFYDMSLIGVLRDEDGDGIYNGTLDIPIYQEENTYKITGLSGYEKAEVLATSFKVINEKKDTNYPELQSIKIRNTSISVPGKIEIIADASDDFSGVAISGIDICFADSEAPSKEKYVTLSNRYSDLNGQSMQYEDGLWHGFIEFDQYQKSAKYVIKKLSVRDKARNSLLYDSNVIEENSYTYNEIHFLELPITEELKQINFSVVNDAENGGTDKITSTVTSALINDINEAKSDATISVDISSDKKLSKTVLNVIKGTKKTLLLNSDLIQWVIKGENITAETKDIDLTGTLDLIDHLDEEELFILGDSDVLCAASLSHKGDLPCKAIVRMVFSDKLLYFKNLDFPSDGLYIYYINKESNCLELIKKDAIISNGNNLEFEVTKGGDYIVSSKELDTTPRTGKPDIPIDSNEPDTSYNSDEEIPTGPSTWEDKEGTEGFVYRLYNVALTRDAEEAGLSNWNTQLTGKTKTAAEVAQGIFFSAEFQNHEYSDVQYVKLLYRTMFGREADEVGLKGWIDKLNSGMSREYVFRGFAESQEFENLCKSYNIERGTVTLGQYRDKNEGATGYVARLYTKMLGRKFEEKGIEYWCKEYLTGKVTIENIATNGFLHSEEFTNLNLSNEEFVTRMYQTFLNREPDESGYKDWVGKLNSGEKTRDDLVYGFSLSQEFANLKKSYGL